MTKRKHIKQKGNIIYNTRAKTKCIIHIDKDYFTGEDIYVCQVLKDIKNTNISKHKVNQLVKLLDDMVLDDYNNREK